jgi:hypothetical protein
MAEKKLHREPSQPECTYGPAFSPTYGREGAVVRVKCYRNEKIHFLAVLSCLYIINPRGKRGEGKQELHTPRKKDS